LDYFWIDENYQDLAKTVEHQIEVDASDHCPILLSLE
jgi:exonuclease III